MHLRKIAVGILICIGAFGIKASPELSFSGTLDADVWTDFTGSFFTNSELDLGLSMKFSDQVSANLYATINSAGFTPSGGRIPAGTGNPAERWATVNMDGFDITYESPIGTFSVGDLVYQYGSFDYYFYKRLSMITPESFTRGVRYSLGLGAVTQMFLAGVADIDYNTTDILGATEVSFGDEQTISAFYGVRGSALKDFDGGFDIQAGLSYTGSFGERLNLKANAGYLGLSGESRSHVVTLLAEPSLSIDKFSLASAFYMMYDKDSINDMAAPLFGINDEMFAYVEPGYSFTDVIALGLPLEYHAGSLRDDDDNAFWVVPTLYVYPAEGVEWWIWSQAVLPTNGGDMLYGFGTEIIVSF